MYVCSSVFYPTAKNVILAGVRSVTLHDTQAVTLYDLSAQFYLTEDDAGKNRAEACKSRLQELNTAVAVSASVAELSEAFLKQFQVGFLDNISLWKLSLLPNDDIFHCAHGWCSYLLHYDYKTASWYTGAYVRKTATLPMIELSSNKWCHVLASLGLTQVQSTLNHQSFWCSHTAWCFLCCLVCQRGNNKLQVLNHYCWEGNSRSVLVLTVCTHARH